MKRIAAKTLINFFVKNLYIRKKDINFKVVNTYIKELDSNLKKVIQMKV